MRYYCPQYSDSRRGWVDVTALASRSHKEANKAAIEVAERFGTVTRVIRKPKGWEPDTEAKTAIPNGRIGFLTEEVRAARTNKLDKGSNS